MIETVVTQTAALLRQHACGVVVITTDADGPVGFSASSFALVSRDPALVSFTLARRSASWAVWQEARYGVIHLLHAEQARTANIFGTSGAPKFDRLKGWRWGPHHLPVLDDVLAWMVVRPVIRLLPGDHAVVICEVMTAWPGGVTDGQTPLIHWDGKYHGLQPSLSTKEFQE